MNWFRTKAALLALFYAGVAFAQLPDFVKLVEEQGNAVVNISTTQAARRPAALPQIPGIEDEEMQEFFRRFMPRQQPGPQQGPRPESRSLGSGFIIAPDGYILTNAHVIDNADEITVKLTDKREYKAKVIGADKRTDVALIKIEPGNPLPAVKFGDPSRLKVGEWVIAIGSPFGFENTVTAGIVSAKGRSLPQENFVPFIQTDVAINPGNSGGPLFNMRGEVVGVNSQIYSRSGGFMGLSFAIPIDVALDIQKQLREKGRVSRGRIGVVIQEVSKDLAISFGLDRPRGALVNSVEKGGPADKAGVAPTDIITRFDGKTVDTSNDLPRIVGSTRPGAKVDLEVWRKGASRTLSVTVGEPPEERPVARDAPRTPKPVEQAANRLGIVVSELSAKQKDELKLSHGLVVTEVKAEVRAELRRGDVLVTLVHKGQHSELRSVEQLNRLLSGLDKNTVITLQVRRGEAMAFITVNGLSDKS
ncbi:MAG: DegQ family serine endoprotease [Betaproteobacteria bacterium]|nr:DegQ family serine endoprotease [Betaproteobacteria bacterium]MSQ88757.1 DegQ family serine endoprotease [Betaproteobacteria bacterium]